jgi:metal-responsive CopG/Arc/MetJ family transcriptional regulator
MSKRQSPIPRAGGDDVRSWTTVHFPFGQMISITGTLVIALFAMSSRLGGSDTATKDRAVQVRLEADQRDWLQRLEDHASGLGLRGYTRSRMIRDAVAAYLAPLVDLLNREGKLGRSSDDWPAPDDNAGKEFGESMRIRLDHDLVEQLNRVEAYARGLGYRHVTRSSLIRDAVKAYVTGFDRELSADLLGRAQSDSVAESN